MGVGEGLGALAESSAVVAGEGEGVAGDGAVGGEEGSGFGGADRRAPLRLPPASPRGEKNRFFDTRAARGAGELEDIGEVEGEEAGGAAQGADGGGAGAGGRCGEGAGGGGVVEQGGELGGVGADGVIGDGAEPAAAAGEVRRGGGGALAGGGRAVARGAPGVVGQGGEDGEEAGAGAHEAAQGQGEMGGEARFVDGGGLEQGPEGETQYECQLTEGVGRLIVRGLLGGVRHGMGKLSHDGGRCKG